MNQKTKLICAGIFFVAAVPLAIMNIVEKTEEMTAAELVSIKVPNAKTGDAELVALAKDEFFNVCPTAGKYWGDLIEANATVNREPYDYTSEVAGWPLQVTFELTVKGDGAMVMPRQFYASGHTLHFKMGGGARPGISMIKEQSANFCGVKPRDDGTNVFIDWPGFKSLVS